jgi:glucose/mannose-6-phosphate isomerase
MEETIKNFAVQFAYKPSVVNAEKLKTFDKFILVGMGGSHLSGGILKTFDPFIDLYIHRDYGLPKLPEYFLKESLLILSSYSGDTEEVLEVGEQAIKENLSIAVMTTGGALLEFAQKHQLPHIIFPDATIQPRAAIGYSTIALATLLGRIDILLGLQETVLPDNLEQIGVELSSVLQNKIPIIYSSRENIAIAYNWKIKLNETGKVPSFYNVFSELNHNEIEGYDVSPQLTALLTNFHVIFLIDKEDHPQIQNRMNVTKTILEGRGIMTSEFLLQTSGQEEQTIFQKVFRSLIVADYIAINLAKAYGSNPEQVPLIEDFKKQIKTKVSL